ncbi:MAG: Serine phosphatase RsbU, regulator of sigma subunit [uncultured Pseudonocardia sp.]|uniref:Serine phosphatase RsbU, regulator of sigma subunit n=1 Tax=uncultured Pseudonocardia sp. TaxID=211455 RepID=A0A6J4NMI8_9PSEU|nr:MAG: Serine phosphatase RsbU, regulator of sigma subunit [uncultured Pseudonocardia sp.]
MDNMPESPAARLPSADCLPGAGRGAAAELLITVLADPGSASTVRERVRAWLSGWQWPESEAEDIVMAVNEAVANVVDHAYRQHAGPGDAHIYAWTVTEATGRRVAVSVTDRGRWRPVPADPGHRGRGLLMMSACMASLHIEHNTGGTSVVMISTLVPNSG